MKVEDVTLMKNLIFCIEWFDELNENSNVSKCFHGFRVSEHNKRRSNDCSIESTLVICYTGGLGLDKLSLDRKRYCQA